MHRPVVCLGDYLLALECEFLSGCNLVVMQAQINLVVRPRAYRLNVIGCAKHTITRGIWGHASQEHFKILDALKLNLVHFGIHVHHVKVCGH